MVVAQSPETPSKKVVFPTISVRIEALPVRFDAPLRSKNGVSGQPKGREWLEHGRSRRRGSRSTPPHGARKGGCARGCDGQPPTSLRFHQASRGPVRGRGETATQGEARNVTGGCQAPPACPGISNRARGTNQAERCSLIVPPWSLASLEIGRFRRSERAVAGGFRGWMPSQNLANKSTSWLLSS